MKQGYVAPVHVNYDNDRRRSLGYRPLWNVQSAQALPRRRSSGRVEREREREQTLRPQDMARPLALHVHRPGGERQKDPFLGNWKSREAI